MQFIRLVSFAVFVHYESDGLFLKSGSNNVVLSSLRSYILSETFNMNTFTRARIDICLQMAFFSH